MAEPTIPIAAELILKGEKWAAQINSEISKAQSAGKKFADSIQREVDKINGTQAAKQLQLIELAIKQMGGTSKLNAVQVENLRVRIDALAKTGAAVPASLQNLGQAAEGAASGTTKLADGVGKISTTLARSVGILGLPADAFRAIDDAADIAELGLRGMEGGLKGAVTSSNLFSVGTLGAVGAAAALGIGIGTLIRNIGGFGKWLDQSTQKLYNWITGVDLAKRAAGPAGFDQKSIAAGNIAAMKQQIDTQKAAGISLQELDRLYAKAPREVQQYVESLKKESKAHEDAIKAADQHREKIEALAASYGPPIEAANNLNEAFSDTARILALPDEGLIKLGDDMAKMADAGLEVPNLTVAFAELARRGIDPASRALAEMGKQIGVLKSRNLNGLLGVTPGATPAKGPFEFGDVTVDLLEESRKKLEENKDATFDWAQQLENIANMAQTLPGFFGSALSSILGGVASIGAALKNIGGIKNLGKALTGGSGFENFLGGVGVIGSAIGGVVGVFKSIFGGGKKKAEELKKKQEEATNAFISAFDSWKQAAHDLAAKGAEGVNKLIGSLFNEDGKFTGEFTSAGNAAAYVAAQFQALLKAGYSTTEALEALGPAAQAMLKDPKKFAGTEAAPLLNLVQFSTANEKLLQFIDGLGTTASSLAGFGLLTQDLTTKIGTDLSNAIDMEIAKGLSYNEALALSSQSLYDLQQASLRSGTSLDAHTQKMIQDAEAAGLFKDLEDPMQQVVEATQATAVAMASLVTLMGGQLTPALQKMVDEFNQAQQAFGSAGTGGGATGGTGFEGDIPQFKEGGYTKTGGLAMLHPDELIIPMSGKGGSASGISVSYSIGPVYANGLNEQQALRVVTRATQTGEGGLRTAIQQAIQGKL